MRNAKRAGVASAVAALVLLSGCGREAPPVERVVDPAPVPRIRPVITERRPHDSGAFTQGLLIDGDVWLESTGRYGESELREVDRKTGDVLRRLPWEDRFFGEGLARMDTLLFQISWQERTGRVVERDSFREVARFSYSGEGWGLASDGEVLYLSDGSATIRVLDSRTFAEMRRFRVMGPSGPVSRLNELEWIRGELWANVFQTSEIVRFTPEGIVLGVVDLSALPFPEDRYDGQDVLNGIAYDPKTDRVWVTGKLWKALYGFSRSGVVDP